ncbi:MAG: hypothetical protein HY300_18350 [Verrucomicrobia bacterium]|nr:hypothetical protein [Verrucomicrobiota bacterium]
MATEVRKFSHAQHFVDRLLEGYGWQGKHHRPALELGALYVDQFPEGDLARERAGRHKVKIYPSVADALTLGTGRLAVDGVLIIGEHGEYPKNENGQVLYPRYKWFKEVVKVFESNGRAVPVFNDKHLSTDWREATQMVEDSRRLKFPFLAGSSLPVTWRLPEVELPPDTPLAESVSVCYGGVDSYDFHGFEMAQCMSERRAGGEVGVKSMHAAKGEKVWELLANRGATQRLLLAALCRSDSTNAPEGYAFAEPTLDWVRSRSPIITAYFCEHLDGFRTTIFLLNGTVEPVAFRDPKQRAAMWMNRFARDFTWAGIEKGGRVHSCKFHLPMPPYNTTLADFFNPLINHVEQTILTGVAPYPVERTLLTTGMTAAGCESLRRAAPLETPWMKLAYRAPEASHFWRA